MVAGKRGGVNGGPIVIREGNVAVRIYRQDRTKQGKGLAFHVADHTSGKRRLRTFANLGDATAEAQRLARLLATGQAHAASFSSADAASYGQAIALLAGTGTSIETACALFAEGVGIVGSPALVVEACRAYKTTHAGVSAKPVVEAVREFVILKEGQGASGRYVQDLRHRLGKLAAAFQVEVDAVATPPLQLWLDGLGLAPQSTRNFKTVLSGFFGFCRSRGWCAANPADGVTVPRLRSDAEPEVFTAKEFAALLGAATADFLPCLVLGGFCGLRSSEIERLHWEDIELAAGEVVVRRGTAKTKSRRIVPLCPAAQQWLAGFADRTGPVWAGTHDDFYGAQEDTAKAARVTWKANGLRHGYASNRLAETGDAVRVAHEMGNSADVVHRSYKALTSKSAGAAWFAIAPASGSTLLTETKSKTSGP